MSRLKLTFMTAAMLLALAALTLNSLAQPPGRGGGGGGGGAGRSAVAGAALAADPAAVLAGPAAARCFSWRPTRPSRKT